MGLLVTDPHERQSASRTTPFQRLPSRRPWPTYAPEGPEHPRSTPALGSVLCTPAVCLCWAPSCAHLLCASPDPERAHCRFSSHSPWELHQIAFLLSFNAEENAKAGVN